MERGPLAMWTTLGGLQRQRLGDRGESVLHNGRSLLFLFRKVRSEKSHSLSIATSALLVCSRATLPRRKQRLAAERA